MKSTVVIYKSVSGFTKKYAEWIAEELNADLLNYSESNLKKLLSYDQIIYGGAIHAVKINGFNLIKDNFEKLKNKKIIVFACGAGPDKEGLLDQIKKHLDISDPEKIKLFYLRGGFNFDKLDLKNKIIMTIFKWVIQRQKNKSEEMKGMLESYENPADFTSRENIKELVEFARKN